MSRPSASLPPNCPNSAAARLEHYLRAKACIPYEVNMPDREYPAITCSIYGVPKTNELFVRLTNGRVCFVAATQSPLLAPAMADRIFGLDVADAQVALSLAETLWEKHREELVAGPRP